MGTVFRGKSYQQQQQQCLVASTRVPMTRAMTTQLEMMDHTAMITTMTEENTRPAMTEMLMEMPAMRTTSRGTAGTRTMRGTGSTTRSWSSLGLLVVFYSSQF